MKIHATLILLGSLVGCLLECGCISETDGPDSHIRTQERTVLESPEPTSVGETVIRDVVATEVLKKTPETQIFEYHEVRQGETITAIADRYGTTVERLAQVNGLGAPGELQVGQRLYLPKAIR